MQADPSMVMPDTMIKQAGIDQQRQQNVEGGNGQQVHDFSKLVNSVNPNTLAMDPATLALMKAQHPDGNIANSVMKSIKWIRKEVDGSFNSLGNSITDLKSIEGEMNMAEALALQLEASTFTFTMTMTTNIVHKGTQHLDTLIKAQ